MLISSNSTDVRLISPVKEIAAYESLWKKYSSFHQIANLFRESNHALPSEIALQQKITDEEITSVKAKLRELLPFNKYSALFYGDFEYPQRLTDAKNPIEVLYYQGNLDLLSSPAVSVVGARKASEEGIRRANKIVRTLVKNDFTVMSGLAKGIDTAAHTAAIEAGGKTIAVIGTPLHSAYPKDNKPLQAEIAKNHLLISSIPFYRYEKQIYSSNRFFFPERNKVMSALSLATIIVEASESSGSLIQARAAIAQGRKLFILKSVFDRGLKWATKFEKEGGIKVVDERDFLEPLSQEIKNAK